MRCSPSHSTSVSLRGARIAVAICVLLLALATVATAATGVPAEAEWTLASNRIDQGTPMRVYVETEKQPGNPAFRIETGFPVAPLVAASTLMEDMIGSKDLPKGQRRTVLERRDREVLVRTFIELPLMLSDRELALRIRHSDDPATGIHRIDFRDVNEVLPEAAEGVVRLTGTDGYWEFRPDGANRSSATYVTRAAVGGSIPAAISDRLMRAQAIDAVTRLRRLLSDRRRTHVAGPPPIAAPAEAPAE